MDLVRHVLGGGGGDREDDTDDGMEEEALLLHEADSSSSMVSTSDEEAGADECNPNHNGFDVSLPARHLYLGQMEEEGQAAMEDEETTPTLPLLCLPDRVLFPGETLPMHIYSPHAIQMLRDVATRHKPVAIVTDLRGSSQQQIVTRPTKQELSQVGTTADVVALREEDDNDAQFWGPCLIVKFLGRQRFHLLDIMRRPNGQMDCRVAILPEKMLPPRPLNLFACPPCIYSGGVATRLVTRVGDMSPYTIKQSETYSRLLQRPSLSSSLCQVPDWVFTLYDPDYLRCKILREGTMMMESEGGVRLPEDIVSLSYWLSRRLPISDREKLSLLALHCPTQRLLRGLLILESWSDLCCKSCGKLITKKAHLFSMSVDGPVAAYVNPGGYVHDTLTTKQAENLRSRGPSSTEYSWFPGYSWTLLECRGCGDHKGWLFHASRKGLNPSKFYGLRRPGLEHKQSGTDQEKDQIQGRGRRPIPCSPS